MGEDQTTVVGRTALFRDTEAQGALLADALASGDDAYVRLAHALIERAQETNWAEREPAGEVSPVLA